MQFSTVPSVHQNSYPPSDGLVLVRLHFLHVACARQSCPSMASGVLHHELRFRGFPYGGEVLKHVCSWACELGYSCLGDFPKEGQLGTLVGASVFDVNVLRYLEDVLKVGLFVRF